MNKVTGNGEYRSEKYLCYFLIALVLLGGCHWPAVQPQAVPLVVSPTRLTGQVVFPSRGIQLLATPDTAVIEKASVRLIAPGGVTMATGLTNQIGVFSLSPQFNVAPAPGDLYMLEAAKGLQNNQVSSSAARLRTFLKWTPDGWDSISGLTIIISAETTAAALIQDLTALPMGNLINAASPVIEPGLKVFNPGSSGISTQDYGTVYTFVLQALNADTDPVEHVGYNAAGEFYYRTIITRPFLSGDVSTFAGGISHLDAIGLDAQFFFPDGLSADDAGSFLYVAEHRNNTIRKINLITRQVTTVAGVPGKYGYVNAADPAQALFWSPRDVAFDGDRNKLYVVDHIQHILRRINLGTGEVSTLAGDGNARWADGIGTAASFYYPEGCVYDGDQYLYVADRSNNRIRRIDLDTTAVTTVAGGAGGYADAALGSNARFNNPRRLAYDPTPGAKRLYVSDGSNHRIRGIDLEAGANFAVTTLAGSTSGNVNGIGAAAQFSYPWGLAFDAGARTLYVADYNNARIRQVNVDTAAVTDFVGGGAFAFAEGVGGAARFYYPTGLALVGTKLYIGDGYNHRVRRVDIPSATVDSLAGNVSRDGPLNQSRFLQIRGLAGDENNEIYYVADGYHHLIRKVTTATGQVTTIAGTGVPGYANGTGITAAFNTPSKLVYDGIRYLYIADTGNNSVRRLDTTNNSVITVNGGPGAGTTADGPLAAMRFSSPTGIAYDSKVNRLYVAESDRLREINLAAGTATTLAGGSATGWVDGPLVSARFDSPRAVAFVGNGVFFLVESHRLRRVDINSNSVSTVAGTANPGYLDDKGLNAVFNEVFDVVTDGVGSLYLADYDNWRIRKYNISTQEVSSVAGGGNAFPTIEGKGASARLFKPYALYYNTTTDRLYVGENSFDYPYPGDGWVWGSGLLQDGQMFRHGNAIRVIQ